MKYTIDRLEGGESLIEVEGPDSPLMQNIRGPGDRVIGGRAAAVGSGVGRERLRLLSDDVDLLDGKMSALREALRAFVIDEVNSNELLIDGLPALGPDEAAVSRTSMEFLTLFAYAALAVELETADG